MTYEVINFKMADIVSKSRSICWRITVWIAMVKAHCVIIIAQFDINLIVVCERIMELQPLKNDDIKKLLI